MVLAIALPSRIRAVIRGSWGQGPSSGAIDGRISNRFLLSCWDPCSYSRSPRYREGAFELDSDPSDGLEFRVLCGPYTEHSKTPSIPRHRAKYVGRHPRFSSQPNEQRTEAQRRRVDQGHQSVPSRLDSFGAFGRLDSLCKRRSSTAEIPRNLSAGRSRAAQVGWGFRQIGERVQLHGSFADTCGNHECIATPGAFGFVRYDWEYDVKNHDTPRLATSRDFETRPSRVHAKDQQLHAHDPGCMR